jgi:DNA-binding LytR/AlgR family response regulator
MDRIKILIVEDDPLFAIELTRIVEEDLGYQVAARHDNAPAALDWMAKTATPPDLALLDIALKGEPGRHRTCQAVALQNLSRFLARISLKWFAQQLPEALFIRVHRNFMVNISMVERINISDGTLSVSGKIVPIGLRFRSTLL